MRLPPTKEVSLLQLVLLYFIYQLQFRSSQALCDYLPEDTWDSFVQMLDSPPSLSILCPFEIKGDACPKTVLGYVIQKNSSLTIMCESNVFGGYASPTPDQASCVIDCPGNLFTVETNASLTIDGLRLKGSQNAPAIDVQSKGEFQAFETTFENNSNPFGNGGAIHSGEGSRLLVTLCEFTNNTSLNGGAIYAEGTSQISNSDFVDNIANQTTSRAGGGAITLGIFSATVLRENYFYGNSAASFGAAVLDFSDGSGTSLDSNYGCSNFNFAKSEGSLSYCNGVERVNGTGRPVCKEFNETCIAAARESPTLSPAPSATPSSTKYPIITPPPTIHPSSSSLVSTTAPTVEPTRRPTEMPTTLPPSADPCQINPESFQCALLELLDAEEESP